MIRSGWSLGRGFASLGTFAALCWSPDDPPAPTPAPTPKPAEPYAVFPTSESFNERVEREARAQLKKKYGLSEKELDERLERAKKLEEAEQERIKAQQTNEERLKGEKEEAERLAAAAKAEAEEAKRQAAVTGICAKLGIKNVDYAMYEAERSKKTPAELEVHFTDLLKDESKKSAFGIATLPPEVVPTPANTSPQTPPGGQPPPAPPPAGGGQTPPLDAMSMTKEQFSAHLEKVKRGGA